MNSTIKKITIQVESEAKNVVLHLPEIASLAEATLKAFGESRAAAFVGELVTLGEAAVKAYEDAHATEITPATIDQLLPNPTPLPAPVNTAASAPMPAATPAPGPTEPPPAA